MKRLLIRADDLGFSEAVNYGICRSVRDGLVGSVGIMTNMPDAAQGVRLLDRCDVCFGQHTNICTGRPLTDPSLIPSLVNENGEFKSSREYRDAFSKGEDFVVLDEVIQEIKAQYFRFKELTGRQPEYFEAHAVNSDNLYAGLNSVSEEFGLPLLPFSFEPVPFKSSMVRAKMGSMYPDYDPYSYIYEVADGLTEEYVDVLVCHPGYLDAYLLKHSSLTLPRAMEVEMLCDPAVRENLDQRDIDLVRYSDL